MDRTDAHPGGTAIASGSRQVVDRLGLAEYLGVSPRSIDNMRLAGCPSLRIGRARRYHIPSVVAWLADGGMAPR
jgi:hypothetical protein